MLTSAEGRQYLNEKLNLCSKLDDKTSEKDLKSLENLPYLFAARDMQGTCAYVHKRSRSRVMESHTDTFLELVKEETAGECVDHSYDNLISHYKSNRIDDAWFYQACTELIGWFYPFDEKTCIDMLQGLPISNATMTTTSYETNEYYGSKGIKGTRIVFPNGSIDIWAKLGLISSDSPARIAVYMKGTGHCADMYIATPNDPDVLIQGRKNITAAIEHWINNPAE